MRRALTGLGLVVWLALIGGCSLDLFPVDTDEEHEEGPCNGGYGTTWYVRLDGGDREQCTGQTDAPYPGEGENQDCAFSHLYHLLPPGEDATPLLSGGDRVIVRPGEYAVGLDAPGAEGCNPDQAQSCTLAPVPPGLSEEEPTCILGNWQEDDHGDEDDEEEDGEGCVERPVLVGHGMVEQVLSLYESSNVVVDCLEITDHSACIADSAAAPCPEGEDLDTAAVGFFGILADEAENIVLSRVHVHGLAADGISASSVEGLAVIDASVRLNGWAGIALGGDLGLGPRGEIEIRNTEITHNGCVAETGSDQPAICTSENGGDGLFVGSSEAEIYLDAVTASHNAGAGVWVERESEWDGDLFLDRCRLEGNAATQLAAAGPLRVQNTLLIGTCDNFADQPYGAAVDTCDVGGSAADLIVHPEAEVTIINNTVVGRGGALVALFAETEGQEGCEELGPITVVNNIFLGLTSEHHPDPPLLLDAEGDCFLDEPDLQWSHNLIHDVFEWEPDLECPVDEETDICEDPLLAGPLEGDELGLVPLPESPAIDTGLSVEGYEDLVPSYDINLNPRPAGAGVDRGAYELQE